MVQLKTKVTLKKGGLAEISSFTKMIVTLAWNLRKDDNGYLGPDYDLMAFYMTKDGKSGFVAGFTMNTDDMGFLDKFPFMCLVLDDYDPANTKREGDEVVERIEIAKLDDLESVYICITDFDEVQEGNAPVYGNFGSYINITTDTGDNFEVPLDSMDPGHIAVVCKIDNSTGLPRLINESKNLSLGKFAETIPGASLIVST